MEIKANLNNFKANLKKGLYALFLIFFTLSAMKKFIHSSYFGVFFCKSASFLKNCFFVSGLSSKF
jgi:hypothetical protein